ncbi:hypothetical protein [Billgrantia sp. C5P2]|uniref:hypothetical protein n=1 Tax=Billgrantia sp. C5P2 TaxID=3436239 RepID=UPI003DA45849
MKQSQATEDKVIAAVREFARSLNSGGRVVADMSALVDATCQLPLSSFEYWERLIRSEFSLALSESTPPKWKVWARHNVTLTWLDIVSRDGYTREKTLHSLTGAAPNAFFFGLAVRRLNDWVPQVRKAAREKLPEMAKATDPEIVAEVRCIVLSNWGSWGRLEQEDKEVVLQLVCDNQVAELLRSKLISSASGPMPTLFTQLGRTPILDEKMEDIASLAIQPSVRAKAYRSLFEGRIAWMVGWKWEWTDIRYCEGREKPIIHERELNVQASLPALLKRSAEDRSSLVRRVSAEVLIRERDSLGVLAKELAEKFSSDKSRSVSEKGLFALKKLEKSERD